MTKSALEYHQDRITHYLWRAGFLLGEDKIMAKNNIKFHKDKIAYDITERFWAVTKEADMEFKFCGIKMLYYKNWKQNIEISYSAFSPSEQNYNITWWKCSQIMNLSPIDKIMIEFNKDKLHYTLRKEAEKVIFEEKKHKKMIVNHDHVRFGLINILPKTTNYGYNPKHINYKWSFLINPTGESLINHP